MGTSKSICMILLALLAIPVAAATGTDQPTHTQSPTAESGMRMKSFPPGLFKSGYYVDVDTPCENASNASTYLIGRSYYMGEINWIVQKGPDIFEVAWTTFMQGDYYDEQGTIRFDSTHELCIEPNGSECARRKRYCPQQQMPNFRNNDIRHIVSESD